MSSDILKNIGFYTLEDYRAKQVNINSPLWRCELLVTSKCNFKCPYCRGMKPEDQGDLSTIDARNIIDKWVDNDLQNIRFSGGEPTLYKDLSHLVIYSRINNIKRIALSTNGSADISTYYELIESGVNDFSISLDSCCSSTGDMLSGGIKCWDKVTENIKQLSKYTYVTVGVVLTEQNIHEVEDIIKFSIDLGVSDIRLITAAQTEKLLPYIKMRDEYKNYPILKYRLNNILNNRGVRGITKSDTNKCPLVIDDMAVLNKKHYPCIIYMREQGDPIGNMDGDIRQERYDWFKNHDCSRDRICKNNCLDVCIDYNNRVQFLNQLGIYR